mmetsp:Transcript_56632/g.166274  ORF Transcript_56632/g.166274 Transcript_56632/m.166274 type:complete len:242 (+) Transcript_56632:1195-1920(+)
MRRPSTCAVVLCPVCGSTTSIAECGSISYSIIAPSSTTTAGSKRSRTSCSGSFSAAAMTGPVAVAVISAAPSPSAAASPSGAPAAGESSPCGSAEALGSWLPIEHIASPGPSGFSSLLSSPPWPLGAAAASTLATSGTRGILPRGKSWISVWISPSLIDVHFPEPEGCSSTRLKYRRVFVPLSSMCTGGSLSTSTMRQVWSYSEWPGKIGSPRKSSAQMQPRLHMSMALVYSMPSSTSGER